MRSRRQLRTQDMAGNCHGRFYLRKFELPMSRPAFIRNSTRWSVRVPEMGRSRSGANMQHSRAMSRRRAAALISLCFGLLLVSPSALAADAPGEVVVSPQAIGEVNVRLSCNVTTNKVTYSASGSGASPVVPIKLERMVSFSTGSGGGGDFNWQSWTTVYSNSSGSWSSPNVEPTGTYNSFKVSVRASYGGQSTSDSASCTL